VECAYWTDKTAVAQYLTKGKTVYAEGYPEADAYTNKEGQASATLRMRVQNIQLLGGNNADGQGSNQGNVSHAGMGTAPVASSQPVTAAAPVDDLPF
jgi:single-strand DNA-binding protein